MALPRFRDRQDDLRARLERLSHVSPHALVRRRLERELRGLVLAELREETVATQAPIEIEDATPSPPAHWLQRWENQKDLDQ